MPFLLSKLHLKSVSGCMGILYSSVGVAVGSSLATT